MIMTDVLHNCQLRQHQRPNYYQPHLVDDIDAIVHSEGELIELVDRLDRTSTTFWNVRDGSRLKKCAFLRVYTPAI